METDGRPALRERLIDLGLCVLVLAALVAILLSSGATSDPIMPVVQAAAAATLLFRRALPVTTLVVTVLAALPMLVEGVLPGTLPDVDRAGVWVPLATPIACFSAMVYGRLAQSWTFTVLLAIIATRPWAPIVEIVAPGALLTVAPAVVGMYVRSQRRLRQALGERAERAERERHLLAEQARTEERARLASEMHDIVTHRVSLMTLHAGALGRTAREDATRIAAEQLRQAGCQALDELRSFVGLLRGAGVDPMATEPVTITPGAGSATERGAEDIVRLVAESRAAGVSVELVSEGATTTLAPVVGRTAYRAVQEALTNAIKHAPRAAVVVRVRHETDRLRLTVSNTAPPEAPYAALGKRGSGLGLTGLRQRVEVVGGELHAGPRTGGGFEVAVDLPAVPVRSIVRR